MNRSIREQVRMSHRHRNVYLTELIPDESPPELVQIRESIRDKLISKGIPVTANIDDAHFMIIFLARSFLRHQYYLDILSSRLPKLPLGHSFVFWDKKIFTPGKGRRPLYYLLSIPCLDDGLAEELKDDLPDGSPEFQFQVRESLRYMCHHTLCHTAILHNRYLPDYITDTNAVIDDHVKATADHVNPVSIDFRKFDRVESDLAKIIGLIHNHGDDRNGGDTRFLVISGCAQTHDMTSITKCLSFTYMRSRPPCFHIISYLDNCSQYCPQPPLPFTLANGILAHCLDLDIADADYNKAFLDLQELYGQGMKCLLILEGISSLDELKEIRKLGDLCNQIGRGSMIILSSGLEIFKECKSYFESQDSVFLSYVDGAALAGQNDFMDNTADGWRPFCVELNNSQLGDVIKMAECRAGGDMPKDLSITMCLDDSTFVGAKRGVGEGATELLGGSIGEVVGDPKRIKLT